MRRSVSGLAASVLTSAFFLAGCGNGTVIGSSPSTPPPPVTPKVTNEFPMATSAAGPTGITSGPDSFLYITENTAGKIAKVTTGGVVQEFVIPTAGSAPYGIVTGPDGRLWFSESGAKVGAMTTSGTFTEYSLPVTGGNNRLAVGPDGNLWMTEANADKVAVISTTGALISERTLPAGAHPAGVVAAPDNNMYVAEAGRSAIIQVPVFSAGTGSEFSTPTAASSPNSIVLGSDGALWFTEQTAGKIARLTTSGSINEFPLGAGVTPLGLVLGTDGNFYFCDTAGSKIGQFVVSTGTVTEFPTTKGAPAFLTLDNLGPTPDFQVYFTEPAANNMGRFIYF